MSSGRVLQKLYEQKAIVILAIIFVASAIWVPYFFTWQNIQNLMIQVSIYGIMGFGMTFAILAREFDLSIGAILAFSGVFLAQLAPKTGMAVAIVIVLVVGILIGMASGVLVGVFKLNSFIVTLCAMFFYNGLALAVSGGSPIMVDDAFLNWLGNGTTASVPNLVWTLLILFVITEYILRRTKFGRNVYAVGGDEQVAALTGISVRFYKVAVMTISALSATIASIYLTGMENSASPVEGSSAALFVISSVVVGGTSLAGGEGSAIRTVIGLFIFGIIDNALSLLNVPSFDQSLITGIMLVLVIGWDYYGRRRRLSHA
ncbi:MAG: ABC transporter permease [Alicyclobacillaceae bacterium]|nr:ABC transporter permease [Alicyclobacillaceae bacterium]